MALTLRKACSLISTRLYRYQWNAVKTFSVENKPELLSKRVAQSAVFEKLKHEYGNGIAFNIIFQENPQLNGLNFARWSKFFQLMESYDFQVDETLSMVRHCPDIIEMKEDELRNRIEIWYNHLKAVDNKEGKILLLLHPQYLTIEPKKLKNQIHFLTEFAERIKKSVKLLLLQCPNVMFDKQDRLLEKMNYLVVNWRFTPLEISRCMALSHSLDFLKLRMTLVEKCGIYKMPYPYLWKKKKKELMKVNNPHLKNLVDTSDEDFAENVARISLEEYQVYEVIFEETLQAESGSDEEIDYDDTDL